MPSCSACLRQHLGAYCVPELFQVLRMQRWTKRCAFWKLGRTDKQLKYRAGPMEKNQTACEGEGGLSRWRSSQESAYHCRRHKRHRFSPWVRKIPRRREWKPTPVFLPGKFHGQKGGSGRLQSMRSQRVGHAWMTEHTWGRRRLEWRDGVLFYNSSREDR